MSIWKQDPFGNERARRVFPEATRAFAGVLLLGQAALMELAELFSPAEAASDLHLKPFCVIIFLTLGLAVFDLGKTILEEEVLMHKLIGLGLYVYPGAGAEQLLLSRKPKTGTMKAD